MLVRGPCILKPFLSQALVPLEPERAKKGHVVAFFQRVFEIQFSFLFGICIKAMFEIGHGARR